jgi:hypothetical protein
MGAEKNEETPWRRTIAHVSSLVSGPPLAADLDVTAHFHPDRLVGEVPLLRHLVSDGVYRSQFEPARATAG